MIMLSLFSKYSVVHEAGLLDKASKVLQLRVSLATSLVLGLEFSHHLHSKVSQKPHVQMLYWTGSPALIAGAGTSLS